MAFQYEPLAGEQYLRLIQILPLPAYSDWWSMPQCIIRTGDDAAQTAYSAVSYVWGSPGAPKKEITIDGHYHQVSENLYYFLCYFRDRGTDYEWLWIDQLCIIQEDVDERNHVVQFMPAIYQRATTVFAWIGCDKRYYQATMEFQGTKSDRSLCVLLLNKYFTRLWIVQEVLLAKSVVMMCGGLEVLFDVLEAHTSPNHPLCAEIGTCAPYLLWDFKNNKGRHRSLLDCLERYSANECERPQDRVYALLGLVRPEEKIPVDYNKTPTDVFVDVVRKLCELRFDGRMRTWERDRYVTILRKLGHQMEVISPLNSNDWEHYLQVAWDTGSYSFRVDSASQVFVNPSLYQYVSRVDDNEAYPSRMGRSPASQQYIESGIDTDKFPYQYIAKVDNTVYPERLAQTRASQQSTVSGVYNAEYLYNAEYPYQSFARVDSGAYPTRARQRPGSQQYTTYGTYPST